jgi:predicted CxxxxCH...CXXCH cytochrome family protein
MIGFTCHIRVSWLVSVALLLMSCSEMRDRPELPVVFADVAPILQENCGYRVVDYLETIRCVPGGPPPPPATLPPDETAPILAVLAREGHAGLLDEEETRGLTTWVTDGAFPANRSTHPGKWNDPRAEEWHGSYLRATGWQPIVDPERGDACGLCHAGSPAPVEGVVNYPPGATDCTDCHDLPGGVMACGTCHGDQLRPYPPRDQCYFPGPPVGGLHATHTEPSTNMLHPLGCQACHFGEDYSMIQGTHGNDTVDVVFQPAWGADASYNFDTLRCATTCHARGGTTPVVAWDEDLDLDCQSCHQNPPAGHATIACSGCHRGINPEGTELTLEAPHINGRVDAF